jgi:hypothetical protein
MSEGLKLILESLEFLINEIIKLKLEKLKLIKQIPKNQILFHYTDLEGLKNIIDNNSFFFSNSAFLNDKQEFVKGYKSFSKIVEDTIIKNTNTNSKPILEKLFKKISETEKSDRYVACFSTTGDLLSQWRAYSNDGKGVCIGFDSNKLKISFEGIDGFPIIYNDNFQLDILNILLSECIEFYQKNKETISNSEPLLTEDSICEIISNEIFNQASKYIGQFKHNAFDEEREFRFEIIIDNDFENKREILYRCGRNNLFVPYIKELINVNENCFPIKEIIIGPSLNSELNKISISSFLLKKGYNINQIVIKESNVPYRI